MKINVMDYYSTHHNASKASLKEAVIRGLASDKGLYVPERIDRFEPEFFDRLDQLSFQEIAWEVALKFFGEDIPHRELKQIVYDTLDFDCPVTKVAENLYALELYHGPTMAFKDVGARFMARMLRHFLKGDQRTVNVLVATSGDTGSAVANGFLGVDGIRVFVLYPKNKVSAIQEAQFTTLGQNIQSLEIDGTFDDCQALVKQAFMDEELNARMYLTSANSINVARFLPQTFYYFNAYARLKEAGALQGRDLVVSVPSGNLGNLTAGLYAKKMGLPVKHFLAANNSNDVFTRYLKQGEYHPGPSVETIANAMDVGAPSNFDRILELYGHSHHEIIADIRGASFTDDQIRTVVREVYREYGYICDPHGACGIEALKNDLRKDETGVFLETAHPAKFKETMDGILGPDVVIIPDRLKKFMEGTKKSKGLSADYKIFRNFLLKVTNL